MLLRLVANFDLRPSTSHDPGRPPRRLDRARLLHQRGARLSRPAGREPGDGVRDRAARRHPALDAAARRKVRIICFSFCALDELPGRVFSYGLEEKDLEAFWKHKLILVVDHARTLMGGTEPTEKSEAVATGHPAITEVALNNIALDIT